MQQSVVVVRGGLLSAVAAEEHHPGDVLVEQHADVVRLGQAARRPGAEHRGEAALRQCAADHLGQRREDRVLQFGQHQADQPGPLAAQLGRALVAENVQRGQHGFPGAVGDPGLAVEDPAHRGLAHSDLLGHAGGDLPPTDWPSIFGGPAWTRTTAPDGTPGEWYLHLFAPEQPDFNWANPEVRQEFEDILRFWFDRGVDGVRIDSAALLAKDPALPESAGPSPYTDRDDVHDIYRAWRKIADEYPGRVLIGEVWLPDTARLARYLRRDELHTAFNFPYLCCPWDAAELRAVIDSTLGFHAAAGAPPTWVLSNHDVDRHLSRYGRSDSSFGLDRRDHSQPVDLDLGTRRARAAALLAMALPGSVYLYQGEELGLWEVEDIPDELRQDPIWRRTDGADPGRDGSRVPLPWSGVDPPFGFSPPAASPEPWLPQPVQWRDLTVEAQSADPASMLALYGRALHARRAEFGSATAMTWLPAPGGVLAFDRGGVACVANLSPAPVELPQGEILLASGPVSGGLLSPDTAAWLRTVRR